jgi:predicted DNA-binding protein
MSNMTLLKAFRLPAELVNRLASLAKATHRSETFYVTDALVHYLEDYADAQIAKDRFNDPKSKIISGPELRKRLGV